MRIDIALKLHPFSHRAGIRCLIPFTTWEVQVFPAKLFFRNFVNSHTEELALPISGPVKGFTVLLHLEKERIEIFGKGAKGYFRYFLTGEGISFVKDKHIALPFLKKESLPSNPLRLSLGVHKKQDWEFVQRRADLAEIFPFWVRLAQVIPQSPLPKKPVGTMTLIEEGKLDLFFQAGFQGILCPRFNDEHHLGLIHDTEIEASPLGLLHLGATHIRRLFFQEEGDRLIFLPRLPKELHAGRITHILTEQGDRIDMEWSKKALKKVIFCPRSSRSIKLVLQAKLRFFRLRKSARQKGLTVKRDQEIDLEKGKTIYLDRFTH